MRESPLLLVSRPKKLEHNAQKALSSNLTSGLALVEGGLSSGFSYFLNDIFGNLRHDPKPGHRPYRPSANLISSHLPILRSGLTTYGLNG